ncbi:tyrosine-type recombinase/integrase [Pelatocladus sp. BLCC-F211]|uniref:tyrosine-type recombinase/integrase n=1 Tax=Pelatocladus sp. BLCC-F211 TaxID=3342752 RepID=UPI0035B960A0
MYQLRLSSKFNRKTIGLGSDKIQALNLALMVDEEIEKCIINKKPIEVDVLKQLVHEKQVALQNKRLEGIKLVEKDDVRVLWDKYVKFHKNIDAWTETYLLTTIKTVTSLVESCPIQKLEQKTELVNWLFDSPIRTAKTSKDRFKLIVAAIDWNSKQGNIPRYWGIEYRDLLNSINIKSAKKSNNTENEEIDIFSVAEVYKIIEALKEETHARFKGSHAQYWKYIYFCWLTGCRPSEAIALRWENIDLIKKKIKICEVQVNASGKILKRQGTKTVNSRLFPINEEIKNLLESIPQRTGYVFRNKLGNPISQQALNEIWRNLLPKLGIKYRIPYQLRHTMISYHANNDFPIHKLAELVGNSETVIKEHYLKLDIERISLPDVIKE